MTAYIGEHLGIDAVEAANLRQDYWQRYGTTLCGLMRHHAIDPQHFLWHTHQFPDLARMIVIEQGLKAMLHRLPGRKILFSNAPFHYAQAVIEIAGVSACFDAIYAVESLRFQSKPAPGGFRHLLHAERLDPHRCIMVEDSVLNLKTAKRLGMKTVWVSANTRQSPCIDVRISSVLDLPRRLNRR
jgi:putative hydrolase of the HAD superfamily